MTTKPASGGLDVAAVQAKLNGDLRLNPPLKSGRLDPATTRAVRTFQKKHHLQVDGVIGPDTRAVLDDIDPSNFALLKDGNAALLNGTTFATGQAADKVAEKVGRKVVGKAVGAVLDPAAWLAKFRKDGSLPEVADVLLYGVGFIAAWPAFAAGLVKALVDDHIAKNLELARASEPGRHRSRIKACAKYSGMAGQTINTMTIASKGWTAWETQSGFWVYIEKPDYVPKVAVTIYQPLLPLQPVGKGGFKWAVRRGGKSRKS